MPEVKLSAVPTSTEISDASKKIASTASAPIILSSTLGQDTRNTVSSNGEQQSLTKSPSSVAHPNIASSVVQSPQAKSPKLVYKLFRFWAVKRFSK